MLVYGYFIDSDELTNKERESFWEHELVHTCYTVGSAWLSACVFGIVLSRTSCLFWPVPVKDYNKTPTQEQIDELAAAWKALPVNLRGAAKNAEPEIFVFENSDD